MNMDSGNFFVNGKEIEIDFDEDLSPNLMKELEKSQMNQLDAFFLRKGFTNYQGLCTTQPL